MNDNTKLLTMGTMTDGEPMFRDIIGQDDAKSKISFYVEAYKQTRVMPHTIFVAGRGQGKTTIARELGKGLPEFTLDGQFASFVPRKDNPELRKPKAKTFVEVNCSTLKSVKQFINSVIIPYVNDKDVTVFFDEASEIPHDITMALLTILNPNPENRTTFALDEYVCDFDFRRQTFLFATSEPQKVFHALLDRLNRIDFEEYKPNHLATIVQNGLKEVKFEENLLLDVAAVLRGNARAAQKMVTNIKAYIKNGTDFIRKDWDSLSKTLTILPLGLSPMELTILRHLSEHPDGVSLTALAARFGLSRESLQKDLELHLLKHGLLSIETTGRKITAKGYDYIKSLKAE